MIETATLPLYCESLTEYKRWNTREVFIGDIPMGGNHPIRVQSMTNTPTLNIEATVEQSIRLINSGCDYIRITTPTIKDAEALAIIKKELLKKGYRTPIIADIHFNPEVAITAAKIVEKIRINPGNFADSNIEKKEKKDKTDYAAEILHIKEKLEPLILVCKEYGTAIRIGTNHGSLSQRIMNKYGDTPEGMVESALEFVRICIEMDFHQIVLSMKSSNPIVMTQAYRLLVARMKKENMNYPLHLGVTEAGDDLDGRIKSAIGIGALLEDGIGDTIRVSLTEDPEMEIPVAKTIVNRYNNRNHHDFIPQIEKYHVNPYHHQKRETTKIENIGGNNVPVTLIDFSNKTLLIEKDLENLGFVYSENGMKKTIQSCDFVYMGSKKFNWPCGEKPRLIYNYRQWKDDEPETYPFYKWDEYAKECPTHSSMRFILAEIKHLNPSLIELLKKDPKAVLILRTANKHGMAEIRCGINILMENNCKTPVIIYRNYDSNQIETYLLDGATDAGSLLIDGLTDGIWLNLKTRLQNKIEESNRIAFGILQASRTRITKTEYISCPGCGRTLFNLMETTALIKNRTSHLRNLKIGIMGCIVNGPGEMADADYGYVGAGNGKITLYKGKDIIEKNIPEKEALDSLINLIKKNNDWIEEEI